MKDKIIQIFGLERDSILQNKKIPKVKFYELDDFNAEKKRIFTNDVKDIYLLAILNEETINIASFKNSEVNYSEVYFIYVELKSEKNVTKIIEVIQKNIQNPVILIFSFKNLILVQFSMKRLSNNTQGKQVIEQDYMSQWVSIKNPNEMEKSLLDNLNISQFSFKNLYVFCEEYSRLIYQSVFMSIFESFYFYRKLDTIALRPKIEEYLENQKNILKLKAIEAETLEFSEKMTLHEKVAQAERIGQLIKNKIKIFLEAQIK